jgi:hypothetical protein
MIGTRVWKTGTLAVLAASMMSVSAQAQTPAPRQAGTVKSTTGTSLTLTTATGDVTVSLPETAKILIVAPGSKDLKSATSGTPTDIAPGDKTIVTGTPGDTGSTFTATRVILMKSSAIAQSHAAEDAAWAQGGGGIVKSVDAADGKIVVANGPRMLTVTTTPSTIVRRYSGDSVRFDDAKVSTIAAVQPGDQLRVRGAKSADGSSIAADELVTGSFHNYSGLITSIDTAAGTITLKDLATKKNVTVAITSSSDLRRMPPMAAQMFAARMHGGAAAGGVPAAGGPPAAGAAPAGRPAGEEGAEGGRRAGRAGTDLSQMLTRMPTETLSGLKTGDAVMIVATSASAESTKSTAVTLLTGVDAILTAQPTGEMTLTPWSVGSGAPTEGGGAPGPGM